MLSELQTQFDALEQRRHRLLSELARLGEAQLSFRPAPGAWSLLEVVHHLLLVDQAILRAAAHRPVQGRMRRSVRQRIGYAAVWLVLKLGVRVKIPVRSVAPQVGVSLGELREQWGDTRMALQARLNSITERTMRHALGRHPIAGPLNAVQTLLFLTRHFDHHARQINRIQGAAGFPAASTARAPDNALHPTSARRTPRDI